MKLKRCTHHYVYGSIIYNGRGMEASVHGERTEKKWHTHTHTVEYYSAIKKNEILLFVTTWMSLEGIKQNKSDK